VKTYCVLKMLKPLPKVKKADMVVLVTSLPARDIFNWKIKEIGRMVHPKLFKVIIIPDGEKAKTWEALEKLLEKFIRLGLTKKSLVIAFGGGSVSDLVGFACSVYKRGAVSCVNIPTTLLAQVDASIGGKTAIDFKGHKNIIGSFYPPTAIFLIADFLESLGGEQLIDGLGEIIKYGLIKDPLILDLLDSFASAGLEKDSAKILQKLIKRSVAVKKYFVRIDPKDEKERHALNVGHTAGHAYELKYGLSHGRAVLLGILRELQWAEVITKRKSKALAIFKRTMERFGIGLKPGQFKVSRVYISHDKKVSGKKIVLPIIVKIGKVKLMKISLDKLMDADKKCNQKQH
jgi:3-dehydroquinate synthase